MNGFGLKMSNAFFMCGDCGYTWNNALEVCPKCGSDKFYLDAELIPQDHCEGIFVVECEDDDDELIDLINKDKPDPLIN